MAEERKSWAPWFQRKIDQRDENHGSMGFVWLDDPEPTWDDEADMVKFSLEQRSPCENGIAADRVPYRLENSVPAPYSGTPPHEGAA